MFCDFVSILFPIKVLVTRNSVDIGNKICSRAGFISFYLYVYALKGYAGYNTCCFCWY